MSDTNNDRAAAILLAFAAAFAGTRVREDALAIRSESWPGRYPA
jgi:hypothetical protein